MGRSRFLADRSLAVRGMSVRGMSVRGMSVREFRCGTGRPPTGRGVAARPRFLRPFDPIGNDRKEEMAAEKTADVPRIRFRTGLPVRSSPDFTDTVGFTAPMPRFSLPDDVPRGLHF